jgi:hypothetical protein
MFHVEHWPPSYPALHRSAPHAFNHASHFDSLITSQLRHPCGYCTSTNSSPLIALFPPKTTRAPHDHFGLIAVH